MSEPSLYSSRSRRIPEQTASDGSSTRPKVNFSEPSPQKPTANRVMYSSSKVVARTKKDFWCLPGRRISGNARVTDNRRSSIGVSRKNIDDDDSRWHQSGQLLAESRSVPAAEWRRGSGMWNGRRGTNATILNGSVGSNRRPGACKDDHESPIRADSNESSLELDQRHSIDDFACQGRAENQVNGNDTARESIDEIRRRVKRLLEQEGQEFSTDESEYLESESLVATDSKLTLGPSEVLTGHSGQVLSLARHDGVIFSAAADGFAQAWDTHTGERLATYEGHQKPVWGLQLTGRTLITGSADGTVRFWDVETAELLHLIDVRRPVRDIALVGDALAVATSSANIDVIDLDTMMRKSTLKGHLMAVTSLVSLDGGTRLASGSHDTFIRVWNPETGACEAVLGGHGGTVGALSVTCALPLDNGGVTTQGRGSQIVSGSADATVRVWGRSSKDGEGWACLAVLDGHRHGVWAVHGSPFSSIFVTGGGDATVQVWAPANTFSPERGSDKDDATGRRFDEGERMKWECVSGVRGTIGAVGAVIICEEGLFFGTSEALITRFPFKSSFPVRDERNV